MQPSTTSTAALNWSAIQASLRTTLGDDTYTTWLANLKPQNLTAESLTLSLPTTFIQSWVEDNFRDVIATTISAELGKTLPITLTVEPAFNATSTPSKASTPATTQQPAAAPLAPTLPSTRLDERYTFDTFVMGRSNEFAFRAAQKAAQTMGKEGYNPMFLHGGVGLGKTHLMHAMAWDIKARNPSARILYLSSERFYDLFMHAMHVARDTMKFKDIFKDVDVLMVDDIQFIAGKTSTQQEFFNAFNRVVDMGKQVVLTADKSPVELDHIEDRLKSRMGAGVVVKVNAPEVETRLAILRSKAEKSEIIIPEPVLNLLAHTIASNVRELEGALNRIVAASRLMGHEITPEFAREQLADLFRIHTRIATLDDIQRTVADYFKIRVADMHSPRRSRNLARPRQIAMYLSKTLTSKSYPDIGRAFGGKDHTTVMHGVKAIENLLTRDPELAEHVSLLTKMLSGKV
ncbi:MAG: chromosomal replication initiator protein DnaA [Alphaproteobacteria bacterium]